VNHTYDSYNMNLVIYPMVVLDRPWSVRSRSELTTGGKKHKKRKNVFENEFCEI